MNNLTSDLANEEKLFIEQFQNRANGPCEIVMRVGSDGLYGVSYVNSFAAQTFGLRQINQGDTPLAWDDLPDDIAQYFSRVFESLTADDLMSLPVFELLEPQAMSFAVTVQNKKVKAEDGWYFWFHFNFSDVTPWLGLQEEVMNARKMESIGALASGVAHDFNNLIMAIQGNAEFVLMTHAADPELKATMERMIKACANGASLTRSLLGFARRQSLLMEGLHVGNLVQDVVELCQRSYGTRYSILVDSKLNSPLEGETPDESKMIMGCYTALSHSLLNVMNNSRDAMPQGGTISLEYQYRNHEVEISIQDTGSGIKPEDMKRVFEPFYTTKGVGSGTGLGLAMVHGIMQQHGGRVSVQSELGKGTRVTFVWPHFVDEEATASASLSLEHRNDLPLPAALDVPKTAFIIEDNPEVMASVKSLLQLNGLKVQTFTRAEDVIALIDSGTIPGMVLVDYTMPGMDGLEFIRTLYGNFRKLSKPPYFKMVLMSGYPPEHFKEFMQEYRGLPLYLLQKPFSCETLAKLIGDRNKQFLRKITSRINVLSHKEKDS